MAVCEVCSRDMLLRVSCRDRVDAIRYGSEPGSDSDTLPAYCHDCFVPLGGFHHAGCDMEACPECGGQLISCPHGPYPDVWAKSGRGTSVPVRP